MPVYEFQCRACGERFERKLSVAERDEAGCCPRCGRRQTERVMSGFWSRTPAQGIACAPTSGT